MGLWRLFLFLGVTTTLWGGAHWYVVNRLLEPLEWPKARVRKARLAAVPFFLLAPFVMIGGRTLGDPLWYAPIKWAGFVYMGFFFLVLVFTAARDLGYLGAHLVRRARKAPPPDEARRRFLLNAANAGVVHGESAGRSG